jgi:hypothetical protein
LGGPLGDIGKLTFLPRGVTSHIDRAGSSSSFLATILISVVNLAQTSGNFPFNLIAEPDPVEPILRLEIFG